MAALLINIQSEDEVIIPSFTFPSTANAFLLQGAKIIFADSNSNHPNIDVVEIEKLILLLFYIFYYQFHKEIYTILLN